MSTKDSPQQEDKHIVASTDVKHGLEDHGKPIDIASGVSEGYLVLPKLLLTLSMTII